MPSGKPTDLTPEQQRKVKHLTFQAAKDAFQIGYANWKAIREAEGYLPFKGRNSPSAEVEERVLDSVRHAPHLSSRRRAQALGISIGTVQKVAERHRLGRLNSRLELASIPDAANACNALEHYCEGREGQITDKRRCHPACPEQLTEIAA